MRKLTVAIIGQGRSGRDIHGAYFHTDSERFNVAYVVDELECRRSRAEREYPGCVALSSVEELFSHRDIDLVVNSTYSDMHYEVSKALLQNGFNTLSEKPCAAHPEQVLELRDIAKSRGVVFAVFQQSRFAPYFEQIKKVLASGELGRIVEISIAFSGFARRWDWQTMQERCGGNLLNTGPHPMDQALRLLDCEGMPGVLCRMDRANTFGDAEDYVKIILTAPDRPLIDLEISSCDAYPTHTYKIQGTRGGLTGSMTDIKWKYYLRDEAPKQELQRGSLRDAEGKPMYCAEKLTWIEQEWRASEPRTFTYAVRKYYDELYLRITQGRDMSVTAEQVAQQIAVIEECHRQNPLSREV